jgi:PAS domain-containing protein
MEQPHKLTLTQLLASENSGNQAVKDANAQLISLFNASPDAFIIIGQAGVIELVNSTTQTMFLYDEQDLLGKNKRWGEINGKHQN